MVGFFAVDGWRHVATCVDFETGPARIIGGVPRILRGDLALLKSLIEAAALRTVIDRRYSLGDIVEAFRYAEAGHKKGHVVIVNER